MHDDNVVRRLAELFQNLGLLQIAFRSDQEAALTSMFDAACRLSGRKPLPITAEQEGAAVEALRQDDALAAGEEQPAQPSPSDSGGPSTASGGPDTCPSPSSQSPSSASGGPGPSPQVAANAEPQKDPEPLLIAAPELSHPGESASNGAAERAVRSVVEQARCLKLALE